MNNTSASRINSSLNKLIYSLITMSILMCLVYINETSSLSTQGYVIADYKKELQGAEQAQMNLKTQVAQQSSILALNEVVTQNSMEKSNPIYINNADAVVRK